MNRLLVILMAAYAASLLAAIACPESLDSAYGTTVTADLMRQMATEYGAAIRGHASNGFAYLLMVLSTMILGYHYLVDVPAGVILAVALYLASTAGGYSRPGTPQLSARADARLRCDVAPMPMQ